MKVQLLVSEWCGSCHQAERIWQAVAAERDFRFEVVDMAQPEGRELANRLRVRSIPALLIDGELKGVGVQSREQALQWVAAAPARQSASQQPIGLAMAGSTRAAVLSAAGYLFLAGAALTVTPGLFAAGAARVAPLHLFTLGFVLMMIYGLGEHMLPRFTGNPIRLGVWSWSQLALTHWGIAGFSGGLALGWPGLVVSGAFAAWAGLFLFTVRVWPVLWPRE